MRRFCTPPNVETARRRHVQGVPPRWAGFPLRHSTHLSSACEDTFGTSPKPYHSINFNVHRNGFVIIVVLLQKILEDNDRAMDITPEFKRERWVGGKENEDISLTKKAAENVGLLDVIRKLAVVHHPPDRRRFEPKISIASVGKSDFDH
ncbi:hypothetical protein NL676_003071 [Syzygium grande]|nr:hypothetical protein NL676_003071 [Syzygium grande]